MSYPFLLISDMHYHDFHQFGEVDGDGVSSRLNIALAETRRAVKTLRENGGRLLVGAGDTFHVRGELSPTVLNPVLRCFREFALDDGVGVAMIAGNHDLETRESSVISNASYSLEHVTGGFVVARREGELINNNLLLVPYDHDCQRLLDTLKSWIGRCDHENVDVVIHAPVNDVIPGIPNTGVDPHELASIGFRRIFCGHYHHHKELVPNKVWSIGALTHQTWGDVGSKAGFMLVWEDRVKWFSSHAPRFVEIDGDTDPAEIPLIVDGNYVKARIKIAAESEVAELRRQLESYGAAGVVIHAERDAAAISRTGATAATGATLEASIAHFITKQFDHSIQAEIGQLCATILNESEVTE